jgi:hypothetical protein
MLACERRSGARRLVRRCLNAMTPPEGRDDATLLALIQQGDNAAYAAFPQRR